MDGGEALRDALAERRAGVEEDAMAGALVLEDGARDHVARRQLGVAVHVEQEARAGLVDHHGALAAQRLGQQRQRIAAGGERGGMELHELEIDQARRRRAPPSPGRRR